MSEQNHTVPDLSDVDENVLPESQLQVVDIIDGTGMKTEAIQTEHLDLDTEVPLMDENQYKNKTELEDGSISDTLPILCDRDTEVQEKQEEEDRTVEEETTTTEPVTEAADEENLVSDEAPTAGHEEEEEAVLVETKDEYELNGHEEEKVEEHQEEKNNAFDKTAEKGENEQEEDKGNEVQVYQDEAQLHEPQEESNEEEELEKDQEENEEETCSEDCQQENGPQESPSDSPDGSFMADSPTIPGEQSGAVRKPDITRQSYSRYNTVSYRKIRKGNTKQRIDEFESMMHA